MGLLPGALALVLVSASEVSEPPTLPGSSALLQTIGHLHDTNTPGSLATVIAPRAFLTASHLAFGPGDRFILNGRDYRILERTNLPGSDLAVGRVDSDFPRVAPLYERDDERHRPVVVFGNGRWKGEPVVLNGEMKGWKYAESGVPGIRWGTNLVSRLVDLAEATPDGLSGFFLAADFDRDAGGHEVHATYGDSGGPVFIDDCGVWKLAAVLSSVDGPFRLTAEGSSQEEAFLAALWDVGGTYVPSDTGGYRRVDDESVDLPTAWYASRISPRWTEIRSLAGLPVVPSMARPADVVVTRATNGPTVVSLAGVTVPGAPQAVLQCAEDLSRGKAPVQLSGFDLSMGFQANSPRTDSVRFVLRSGRDGEASTWGAVYVVEAVPARSRPQMQFDPAGTAVGSWPIERVGQPVAEVAADTGGDWEALGRPVVGAEGRWWLVDDRASMHAKRFYRLRYDP